MKTFKEFLEERTIDFRKLIKSKKHQKTIAYAYPIGVGGVYYGMGSDVSGGGGE